MCSFALSNLSWLSCLSLVGERPGTGDGYLSGMMDGCGACSRSCLLAWVGICAVVSMARGVGMLSVRRRRHDVAR